MKISRTLKSLTSRSLPYRPLFLEFSGFYVLFSFQCSSLPLQKCDLTTLSYRISFVNNFFDFFSCSVPPGLSCFPPQNHRSLEERTRTIAPANLKVKQIFLFFGTIFQGTTCGGKSLYFPAFSGSLRIQIFDIILLLSLICSYCANIQYNLHFSTGMCRHPLFSTVPLFCLTAGLPKNEEAAAPKTYTEYV